MTKRMLAVVVCWISISAGADPLESGFANPPAQTKPWCYWYWISDNISKEGITKDLEAMARVGIGEALIGNIYLTPEYGATSTVGNVKVLSQEWWELVEHAIREGGRTGVNIALFNCPGWSQSGGPWIKPEQTMRYLVSTETRVTGPAKFAQKLPAANEQFQDVAVLAYPAPQADADLLKARAARVTCDPPVANAEKLLDGDLETSMPIPAGNGPIILEIETASPFTARSLAIHPATVGFGAKVALEAADSDGKWQTVRQFEFDRWNMKTGVGPMPRGPVMISFAPTTAKKFRLVFTGIYKRADGAALAEIDLSGAARVESFVEKQLGKMHPTPLPLWDTYLWPTQAEPDSAQLAVPLAKVRDLSAKLDGDGTLTWDVPPGEWIIQRTGMTPTGMSNSPASPEGQGLEVDKLNRKLAQHHFDAFIGELLQRMPAPERKAFKQIVADSYEMGSQNWTDGFGDVFEKHYGYDPKPWLPVLSGRVVGSADQSERFLWDLRRLVAERVATEYVGGLRAAANARGLGLWLENYGHWGFPSEFLKYGSESDRIGGEFWVTGDLGSIECRAASSCANIYGKKFVSAESFTGGPAFQNSIGALKARGDWSFSEGVNHVVLHVYIHQPWEDKVPGVNAWFGTEFNRHNTWFEQSKVWIDYLRRSCWLLQQGHRVTDVGYFIGEDAPKMTGTRQPELPPGRDFDYINAEVIERDLTVKDGVLTLPHGTTYRVLVLPEQSTMRPELMRKIRDLVKAGATVVGLPPSRSPSLKNFPKSDEEVRQLAREVWADADLKRPGERVLGKGRVIWGKSLDDVFAALGSKPDFECSTKLRFTHRRAGDADIYFVANPKATTVTTTAAFRINGKAPELWWPDSGRIEYPAVYDEADGRVRLPLTLGPQGSVFVVFRAKAAPKSERIISVTRNGREVLGTTLRRGIQPEADDQPNNFTFALWVKPGGTTTLPKEANHGVLDLNQPYNEVVVSRHGNEFGGGQHAGAGLAVGRNGVCVLEHAADYFAAPLVYAGEFTNWTHVTVVYRDGQSSLYLNGRLARMGLPSTRIVHSSANRGSTPSFRGARSSIEQFTRALSDAEVRSLMESMPHPGEDVSALPLQLTRTAAGRIEAQGGQGGDYELHFADGQRRSLRMTKMAVSNEITGPWEVSFVPPRGTPIKTTFPDLTDWAQQSEVSIKCFSGTATYRRTFTWKPENPASSAFDSRVLLDLGEVRDLATVRLNGREFTTLWMAPWRVDVTTDLKSGTNLLEIEVINPWNNRLVGDASLPESQRQTVLLADTVNKNSPLLPAGLLGPVRLMKSEAVEIK